MDFVSDLDDIDQMTEAERVDRENRTAPVTFIEKVDRALFEGKY